MEYRNLLRFKWPYLSAAEFIMLLLIPNLVGLIHIPTAWGFKIHLFQVVVFVAAIVYGPMGGLLSGLVGTIYASILMGNPYIMVGNAILGFAFGVFLRGGIPTLISAWLAFLVQMPWLVITDYFLIGMSLPTIGLLLVALLISDTIWALVARAITR